MSSSSSSTTTDKKLLEKQLRSACEYDEKEKASNLISEQGVDVNTFDERVGFLSSPTVSSRSMNLFIR